jgi:SAM-dependent methyltransferase
MSKKKFLGWGFVDGKSQEDNDILVELEKQMSNFYNKTTTNKQYWLQADSNNKSWNAEEHPYHCHLKSLIEHGSHVIDFGCGSAHPMRNLQDKNVEYTGVEWSKKQVEINRDKYPKANFAYGNITADYGLAETADWAVSFFVLEHCVRPHLLLQRMYESIKPGGQIGIICPNFISGMNSIRTGFRATSKKNKLRSWQLIDALFSYYQELWVIPRRVKKIHQSSIEFPIYIYPRCLNAPYYSDNDAVYLTNESIVARYLEKMGAKILFTSISLDNNCNSDQLLYIVAQKPHV